ncbi:MAG: NAD(P)/FAD-dependent oxidoreductase [Acidimicrobiales bacterium]
MAAAAAAAARVVVVGGGVGGLSTALALARRGRQVVVLERDPVPESATVEAAFATERPGAPQVHQTHGFLAKVMVLMRERFPDLLDALSGAGCSTMSGTAALGEAQPGDEDLAILLVRRSTFEWILRRAVADEPGVELRTTAPVRGILRASNGKGVPTVTGVVLGDGTELAADIVVAATGRRGDVPAWAAEIGVSFPETIRESGLMYLTRWYRLDESMATPPAPKLGGDLGYLKFLIVPTDGGMLSATLAIGSGDRELRRILSDPDTFDHACRNLPGPDEWFGGLDLEAIGGVRPMGGLLNRIRKFTDDAGAPSLLNFHAVGDSHTCTNPLYGRGCSLGMLQGLLLADALDAHDDRREVAAAYEGECRRQVEPWYHHAVELDRVGADPVAEDSPDFVMQGRFRALMEAGQTDPIIGRGMARLWNLLTLPAELNADPRFAARAAAIMGDPANYPTPERPGPAREVLLGALAA